MREAVSRIVDRIGGLTVIGGEAVLDNARRLVWLHLFTGRTLRECAAELAASPDALEVARLLSGAMSEGIPAGLHPFQTVGAQLHQVSDMLFEVQIAVWIIVYQKDQASSAGRQARAWLEEVERYAKPPGSRPN